MQEVASQKPTAQEPAAAPKSRRPLTAAAPPDRTTWERFWHTVSSGLFFMVVGIVFLVVSTLTVGKIHAGMTFIFVVIGVAIVLYGTGTQATGTFDGSAHTTTFKLSLAGGAGALAFATAAGIVFFQEDINRAFREESRLLQVTVPFALAGSLYIDNYLVAAEVDGEPVATGIRGTQQVLLFVPYKLGDHTKHALLKAVWSDPSKLVPKGQLANVTISSIPIDVEKRTSVSGGEEMPTLEISSLDGLRYFLDPIQQVSGAAQIGGLTDSKSNVDQPPPPIAVVIKPDQI